ncbi:MAG: TIGR02710 family CRISPR-associated protein [Nitrospirae bacterium]|nr:MAG: TIGR02710 family CRISPR-associated protein [Nitrospirota bacterium]
MTSQTISLCFALLGLERNDIVVAVSTEGSVKALLIAVTDAPGPVIACLRRLTPELLCFFLPASRQACVDSEIHPTLTKLPQRWDSIVTPDASSFPSSLQVLADRLPVLLRTWTVAPGELAIDVTCATPAMAAAMALVGLPFAGRIGTSNVPGQDEICDDRSLDRTITWAYSNPWDRTAEYFGHEAADLFNLGRYAAAAQGFRRLEHRVSGGLKPLYRALGDLSEGYSLWDRFGYRQAWDKLKTALKSLELSAAWGGPSGLQTVLRHVKDNFRFLEQVVMDPQAVKPHLGADLLAHAKRRVERDRNIEVGTRVLLRALEVYAQTQLFTRYHIKSWDVDIDRLPQALKETCRTCYLSDVDGKYHLPLHAQFRVLAGLGDAMGQAFLANWAAMKSLMDAADHAILGGGFTPIKLERFSQLYDMVLKLCQVRDVDLPTFPTLKL